MDDTGQEFVRGMEGSGHMGCEREKKRRLSWQKESEQISDSSIQRVPVWRKGLRSFSNGVKEAKLVSCSLYKASEFRRKS